jgi:hypothetical protein
VAICYLAYLLLSLLKFRLKDLALSPEAALRELNTMYKVYRRDQKKGFRISRVVTLSKKQEQILIKYRNFNPEMVFKLLIHASQKPSVHKSRVIQVIYERRA